MSKWLYGTRKQFVNEVKAELSKRKELGFGPISASDLEDLPRLLQAYLIKVGVVGKPKVKYFKAAMSGEMKLDKDKDYAPVKVEQYTFIDSGKRLFHITMKFKGIPISGIHFYHSEDAMMRIKILDLFKVVDYSGESMHRAETVTYFNDLCIMAPGALLEEGIQWETIDDRRVKGTLTKHGHMVSAILTFSKDSMLENFVSNDRLSVDSKGNYESHPWSTPMSSYESVGDYYIGNKGHAVWHYPDGDFHYIKMVIEDVKINTTK